MASIQTGASLSRVTLKQRETRELETALELEEIKRITPNIAVLIDSERTSEDAQIAKERADFEQVCKNANLGCHVLKLRAIENYLTDAAVKSVLGPKYQALGPYEKLEEAKLGWSKSDNWRIARLMKRSDVESTDLGQFLAKL